METAFTVLLWSIAGVAGLFVLYWVLVATVVMFVVAKAAKLGKEFLNDDLRPL
jgi:hypothetical protein